MPVTQEKLRSGLTRVRTPGGVKAKGTTRKKADAQTRLLRGVEHGFKPTGKQGLASITPVRTAMSFGTTKKNPPPKPKNKKGGWLLGGKTGWDMVEQMEREAQGAPVPKAERRKKKKR